MHIREVQLYKQLPLNWIIIIWQKNCFKTCCSVWNIIKFLGLKLCTLAYCQASTTATHSTMALTENIQWIPCRELQPHWMDFNELSRCASNSSYPPTHLTAAHMSPQQSYTWTWQERVKVNHDKKRHHSGPLFEEDIWIYYGCQKPRLDWPSSNYCFCFYQIAFCGR